VPTDTPARTRAGRPSRDSGPARPTDTVERSRGSVATSALTGARARGTDIIDLRTAVFLPGNVKVSDRGFTVDGSHTATAGGITQSTVKALEETARRLCREVENPFRGRGLNPKVRKELVEHLDRFLVDSRDQRGRPSLISVRSRAAAFALLVRLGQVMTRSSSKLQLQLFDRLLQAATNEPHPGLKRQMLLGLDALPGTRMSAGQVELRRELVAGLRPASPPYDSWFGDDPAPKLNVKQFVMGEFFRREVAAYRKAGFTIKKVSDDKAIATKVLSDPDGDHAPVTARVELVKGDERVLDDMDDPKLHMLLYSGHAQLGAVAKWSLAHGPTRAVGDKLVGFFACRGKQWLGSVRRRYPDTQVIVSDQGTHGNDDRIVIQKLYEGIATRSAYETIRRAVEREDVWEPDNYLFPHDRRNLEHLDLDSDGRAARSGEHHDLLYTPVVKKGRSNSISFKPHRRHAAPHNLDGAKVSNAVAWFNTEYFYWTEDNTAGGAARLADRFYADGWFASDDPDEVVRLDRSTENGKPVMRVQVNAAYAHLSDDAVGMLVTYTAATEVFKQLYPDELESERRMRCLAMTGAYVANLVEYADVADALLKNFAKRFDFPSTLTWPVVDRAINSDHDHEASAKVIKWLEKGMNQPFLEVNPRNTSLEFRGYVAKALKALRRSDSQVGRDTYEAIATGRIKLDELSDLTRPDYLHLRKELLPDGVRLKLEDYERLHKPKVLRAITENIDGYMWDERIYVTRGQTAESLAATLVHEVNHVINASEENYRSDLSMLVEEYRAFYAEELFKGREMTPERCRRLKESVIRDYGLDDVGPDDVADVPPGHFAFGEE